MITSCRIFVDAYLLKSVMHFVGATDSQNDLTISPAIVQSQREVSNGTNSGSQTEGSAGTKNQKATAFSQIERSACARFFLRRYSYSPRSCYADVHQLALSPENHILIT
jgi:hypothetical protein